MKAVWFECYISYGKCDSNSWDEEIDLTCEEYERLVEVMKNAIEEGIEDFYECEEVADIYDKVYEIVVERATENILEFDPEAVEEYLEDEETDEWRADDIYPIGVNFPRALYDQLMEEYED